MGRRDTLKWHLEMPGWPPVISYNLYLYAAYGKPMNLYLYVAYGKPMNIGTDASAATREI